MICNIEMDNEILKLEIFINLIKFFKAVFNESFSEITAYIINYK